jgi:hypothetical protein
MSCSGIHQLGLVFSELGAAAITPSPLPRRCQKDRPIVRRETRRRRAAISVQTDQIE